MPDEENDSPSSVQPRATDFLSAAVERRARAASAIVSGEAVAPAVNPFKVPLVPKNAPVATMEADEEEPGVKLRPTKGPVQPLAKATLLPPVKISAQQEEILSRIAPAPRGGATAPTPPPPSRAPERPAAPAPPPPPAVTPAGGRRTRALEMPEPGERGRGKREYYSPEWDRYYNPGFFAHAKIPKMPIERRGEAPDAPAWTMIGGPKGEGVVTSSRAPYRASLKEGARVKDSRPEKEVAKFLAERAAPPGTEQDLDGPAQVPTPGEDEDPDAAHREEFEAALADLERSFQEAAGPAAPARAAPVAPAPRAPAPPAPRPRAEAAVQAAAGIAMPFPRTSTTSPPPRAIARARTDPRSEEDETELVAQDEEEETLGRQPPPDRTAEAKAHRALQHDASGAALCPTCGRRIAPSNQVMVCTSCGRVACASCGKFSAGQPTGNIYQYEYTFHFPLCQPCFERHFNIQKNLARSKAYLASGNLTYAFYHAQSALQLQPDSPYSADASALVKQVEARRAQMAKAEKEWEEARRKIMRERTTVLK